MTTLDHAMHDLALARFAAERFGGDNSAHVAKLAARVEELQRQREREMDFTQVRAVLKRFEQRLGITRNPYLEPLGIDENRLGNIIIDQSGRKMRDA